MTTLLSDLVRVFYAQRVRAWLAQIFAAGILLWIVWFLVVNTATNLAAHHMVSGFGFLSQTAGFEIDQSLIQWKASDTFARALLVAVLNTLLVALISIVLATVLGVIVGFVRLSRLWLGRVVARAYVEFTRNTPLLLQILFWYFAVLEALPGPRQSIRLAPHVFLNVRGIYLPFPDLNNSSQRALELGGGAAVLGIFGLTLLCRRVRIALWARMVGGAALVVIIIFAVLAAHNLGASWSAPKLAGLDFTGGAHVHPEFLALTFSLVLYFGAFISEIVRAGVSAIQRTQLDAAHALGLSRGQTIRLVVFPQALRLIIPPLASQYMSLTKATSLGFAIAYPDLMQLFAGTVLNQSGRPLEVIFITVLIYLSVSMSVSLFMNWYNSRVMVSGS
jgi:general L-amino acid transport system permease protein